MIRLRLVRVCIVVALGVAPGAVGCGDDTAPNDAGGDAAIDGSVGGGVAPAALPSFLPCADGFREVGGPEGTTLCEPFPETGIARCDAGAGHFVGTEACTVLGTACAADGWPSDLPTDRTILYVRAGASGGDGTRALPFGRIADGARTAGRDGVVALAVGRFDELVHLDDGVTLWGACAEGTLLGTSLGRGVAIEIGGGAAGVGGALRNLAVAEVAIPGVVVIGGTVALDAVEIRDVVGFGLMVQGGATVTGHRVVVRDVALDAADTFGRGVQVLDASTVDLSEVIIERAHNAGAWVGNPGTTLRLSRFVVHDIDPRGDQQFGRGIDVGPGGRAELSWGLVEDVWDAGILVDLEGASAHIEDVRIRDVVGRQIDGERGRGFAMQLGGSAELARVVVERTRSEGLSVGGTDTHLVVEDILVADLRSTDGSGIKGNGLQAFAGATLEARRVLVSGFPASAFTIGDPDTTAIIEDFTARDGRGTGVEGTHGHGVQVQAYAHLTGARIDVAGVRGAGIGALDGTATLTDVRVSGVLPWACSTTTCPEYQFGHGMGVYLDSVVTVTRFDIAHAAYCGMHLVAPAELDLQHGVVSACEIGACLESAGYAIDRLTDDVEYRDNTANLDSTTLPIPDAVSL